MRSPTKIARPIQAIAWVWGISLVLAPLLYIVAISFMTRGEYGGVGLPWTLDAYRRLLDPSLTGSLIAIFGRSLGLALLTTVSCIAIGFPLALFLVFQAGRLRTTLFFLLIIPFWTNFLIRTYAWQVILSDHGWLNHLLQISGISATGVHWLFTQKAVFIGMLYNYLPYMAMSLYVSLEKLDVKLLDAAADLGAGPGKRFLKIILPLSLPGLIAGSIMVFVPALGEFVIPDVLGGGTSLFIGNYLAQQFLVVRNWPFGAALSVAMILLVGVILLISKQLRKEGVKEVLA